MATDLATKAGMGRGEFQGCFANWRALCVAAAPLLYGKVYEWSTTGGNKSPGMAYFVAAAIVMGTEGMFQTLTEADLQMHKKD
jgi:hypothetical protein